jgi:hypothetical protein
MKHFKFTQILAALFSTVFAMISVVSCGPMQNTFAPASPGVANANAGSNGSQSVPSTPAGSSTAAAPTPMPTAAYQVEAVPLWENVDAGSRAWTLYAFGVVDTLAPAMVAGSDDMDLFCPNYSNLTRNEKLNFWVYLASAVAKYESDENPLDRYQESTMGIDPVTKQPVWSEGLLQLSYQDELNYPFCIFNWAADSKLSPTDPNKTILQPDTNLLCGLQILNHQIANVGKIGATSDVYWSTLKPGGTYTAIPQIEKLTNAIPFCQL